MWREQSGPEKLNVLLDQSVSHLRQPLQPCPQIGCPLVVVEHLQIEALPWPDSLTSEGPQVPVEGNQIDTHSTHRFKHITEAAIRIFSLCKSFYKPFLTNFCRSSLAPTWTLLKKIWGTVLRPVSSFTLALSSACLPRSTSYTGSPIRPRVALACTQCGQPWMEYTVTRPRGVLANSSICSNNGKTEEREESRGHELNSMLV